jgi:hypothetical protein
MKSSSVITTRLPSHRFTKEATISDGTGHVTWPFGIRAPWCLQRNKDPPGSVNNRMGQVFVGNHFSLDHAWFCYGFPILNLGTNDHRCLDSRSAVSGPATPDGISRWTDRPGIRVQATARRRSIF